MPSVELLRSRLATVARELEASGDGLGLLALGSAGVEDSRLDEWSDLDFFLVVRPGSKPRYLADPLWLGRASPLAWSFRNTADGFKLLFADGVFAEMAWFEPAELASARYAPGRWLWRSPELDEKLSVPRCPAPSPAPPSVQWSLGELLSCLYAGLCRWNRGERLSGWRFVQCHCLDRFLELADSALPEREAAGADPFSRDRRWERRHPGSPGVLARFIRGIDETPAAALELLAWCEAGYEVNAVLAREIRRLAGGASAKA